MKQEEKREKVFLHLASILLFSLFLWHNAKQPARIEGQDSPSSAEDARTEITLAVWDVDKAFLGDDVLQAIEDKFQINLVPVNITWDDYEQKIKMWASSGNLPDLFVGDFRNSAYYSRWAGQGLLQALPEDLSPYPHLQEYLEAPFATESTLHGKLYCIPRESYPSQAWTSIDRYICYRWDLAQKAGVTKEPETWQEFQEMMLKIIEKDPEGKGVRGLTASHKNLLCGVFMPYASPIALNGGTGFYWVEAEDETYQPAYFCEDLLPGFALARELYQSGAIDPEVAMTTNATANERFLKGENAAIAISGGFANKYFNISRYWEEYHGSSYLEDVKALRLMPDQHGNKAYPIYGYAWSESYISSAAGKEKMDKILQLYDYLLSEEGAFLATYGIEGKLYERNGDRAVWKGEDRDVTAHYPSCAVFSVLARWNPWEYDGRFPSYYPEAYHQIDKERVAEAEQMEVPAYYPRCHQVMMELGIDFSVYPEEDFLTVMTGEQPVEEMWEEIREQYEDKGLEDMVKQVNEAL